MMPANFQRLLVIANPNAGQDSNSHETLTDLLKASPLEWELYLTEGPNDARRKASEAANAGYDVVAAHGGDGTVMEVADGLRGSDVPLAIIPGGTANVMSVEMGVPRDLSQSVALITNGQHDLRTVDMGMVNGGSFLLRIGVGWEAEITVGADPNVKARFGSLAYIQSALNAMREIQPVHYRMVLDGEVIEAEGINLSICNSGNLGVPAFSLAPNIAVDDGMLDVVIIRNSDLGSFISLLGSIVNNALPFTQPTEAMQHWQARKLSITAEPPQVVTFDGETPENPFPLNVEVLPSAIRVVVPQPISV
jgi:diacylglycerol kinase (ATP)